jgi:hypothetical protein
MPADAYAHGEQVVVMLFSWAFISVMVSTTTLAFWKETVTTKLILLCIMIASVLGLFFFSNPVEKLLPSSAADYLWIHPVLGAMLLALESFLPCIGAYLVIRLFREKTMRQEDLTR